MPLKPDPLPELPVPNPNDGPWPTFSVSLADRQAKNNGSIRPVKPRASSQFNTAHLPPPVISPRTAYVPPPVISPRTAYVPPPVISPRTAYVPPPVRRRNFPIRRVVVLSLLLLAIIGAVTGMRLMKVVILPPKPTTTPAATSTSGSPSGFPIVPVAASIITHVQTSAGFDSRSMLPTQVTSTFTLNQVVYITFNVIFNGQVGTVEAKFYADSQPKPDFTNIIKVNDGNNKNFVLFPANEQTYNSPTQGAAELYWCPQYDCSKEQLASFVNFSVSNTASSIIGRSILTG